MVGMKKKSIILQKLAANTSALVYF